MVFCVTNIIYIHKVFLNEGICLALICSKTKDKLKNAKELLHLNKEDLRLTMGLLVGHFQLRFHLSKIGKNVVESTEHLLYQYNLKISSARTLHF